ncbi:hypothetical protein NDI85_19765 [Halomicroarcula sp. S1AR25-4]|uniref:hypothetical protein n=1 Tax=Haloarcula sp. S1AR25-4 TaxID=2950538 RepID=UPI002875E84D|nr:hypothetical protein [Halomicroarcula sp. S1AR25-4]MDS0280026.1 hypothetical protein [Halomicroarcula sp. S1AR25-4]
MDDADRATEALRALGRINPDEYDDRVQQVHDDAVAAVDALVALLEASDEDPDVEAPDEWDDDEWDEAVEVAREKAGVPAGTGTLTTKAIDGREYYYLQWREGESVTSQYVGPVEPAD